MPFNNLIVKPSLTKYRSKVSSPDRDDSNINFEGNQLLDDIVSPREDALGDGVNVI